MAKCAKGRKVNRPNKKKIREAIENMSQRPDPEKSKKPKVQKSPEEIFKAKRAVEKKLRHLARLVELQDSGKELDALQTKSLNKKTHWETELGRLERLEAEADE